MKLQFVRFLVKYYVIAFRRCMSVWIVLRSRRNQICNSEVSNLLFNVHILSAVVKSYRFYANRLVWSVISTIVWSVYVCIRFWLMRVFYPANYDVWKSRRIHILHNLAKSIWILGVCIRQSRVYHFWLMRLFHSQIVHNLVMSIWISDFKGVHMRRCIQILHVQGVWST